MREVSRRGFLGAAGAAVMLAVPRPGRPAPHGRPSQPLRRKPGGGLAGAIVANGTYGSASPAAAAGIFDGYVGMPLATTIQKIYLNEGELGVRPPAEVSQLAPTGCQFLISVKPERQRSAAQRSKLAAWLAMMNKAGITYRTVLWQEANDDSFPSMQDWLAYWHYYAPVIKAAKVTCGYDPGCNPAAVQRARQWFPVRPAPDELWLDYYATAFAGGARIDPLLAQARAAGIGAGLAEWGWEGNLLVNQVTMPMTIPVWDDYCDYLIALARSGQLGLGAIYSDSLHQGLDADVIRSSDDPRIPMIRKLSGAVRRG